MVVSSDIAKHFKNLPKQQTEPELKTAPEIQQPTNGFMAAGSSEPSAQTLKSCCVCGGQLNELVINVSTKVATF